MSDFKKNMCLIMTWRLWWSQDMSWNNWSIRKCTLEYYYFLNIKHLKLSLRWSHWSGRSHWSLWRLLKRRPRRSSRLHFGNVKMSCSYYSWSSSTSAEVHRVALWTEISWAKNLRWRQQKYSLVYVLGDVTKSFKSYVPWGDTQMKTVFIKF